MGEPWPRGGPFGLSAQAPAPGPGLVSAPLPEPAPAERGVLGLYAALLQAPTLQAGAQRLAAALAAEGCFDRVTVGVHESGRTRLIACSQGDVAQLPHELQPLLIGAMDEALEQSVALAWPATARLNRGPASPARPACQAEVLLEHALLQRQVGGTVMTVPLGAAGEHHAAVCVERRDQPLAPAPADDELQRLEALLVLAAPALRWLHIATEPAHRRAYRNLLVQWQRWRQPSKQRARRIGAAALLGFAFLLCVPLSDPVAGRARVEGAEQRVMPAPTDGFIKTAHVRPGDRVQAGAPLVDLLEADLQLERERWGSQLAQHENAYASSMARSDRVAAATSLARVSEAQAQLGLVDEQLARGRVTAPFDALVIQGDLSQSIGAPVRQGDTLMTLATSGRQRVIVEVDEVDIARVQPGQAGSLALSSLPWDRDELVVERIAPLAKAVDGRNVFEVVARLSTPREDVRPGLLGRAELQAGRAPLLWAWTRHTLLRLRVAVWAWLL